MPFHAVEALANGDWNGCRLRELPMACDIGGRKWFLKPQKIQGFKEACTPHGL